MKMDYNFKKDIESVLELKGINIDFFCKECGVPKRTMFYAFKNTPSNVVLNKTYSQIYKMGLRLSYVKSELFEELAKDNELILYHGSKLGIKELTHNGSRQDCDFGPGLYMTKNVNSAISFVDADMYSSVYAFKLRTKDLKIYEFKCDLEWMLTICYFRGKINSYKDSKLIQDILNKIKDKDLLIGPIADNKMFETMSKFANGEITSTQAIHALSASRLGKQYVIKSKKALQKLIFIDRLYFCDDEKKESLLCSKEQENIIQTKLDFAKRNFKREGKYIDEVLK